MLAVQKEQSECVFDQRQWLRLEMGFLPGVWSGFLIRHHNVILVASEISLVKRGVDLSCAAEDGAHDEMVFVQLTSSQVQVSIQRWFVRSRHKMSLEKNGLLLEALAGWTGESLVSATERAGLIVALTRWIEVSLRDVERTQELLMRKWLLDMVGGCKLVQVNS